LKHSVQTMDVEECVLCRATGCYASATRLHASAQLGLEFALLT